jgi:hypothetical protein
MLAVDNEAKDVDTLHNSRKGIERLSKGRGAAIGVRRKLADHIRAKRYRRRIVAANRIEIRVDYVQYALSHCASSLDSRASSQQRSSGRCLALHEWCSQRRSGLT